MVTQNAKHAPEEIQKETEQKFDLSTYGQKVAALSAAYLLFLALGILIILASTFRAQDVLTFAIFTTFAFWLLAVVITMAARPTYVPKFSIKPIYVSGLVTLLGLFFLLAWISLRQPDDEGRLRVIMVALTLTALFMLIGYAANGWYEKQKQKPDTDKLAVAIAVIGAMVSAVAAPALLRIEDPTVSMRLSILLLVLGFVLFFALIVLSTLNKSDAKPAAVSDGHAGVVRVKGRIARVTFDKSIDVKLNGEKFEELDLRLRMTSVDAKDCLTADHVPTDVQANVEWKLLDTEEGVRAYYTKSSEPAVAIRSLASAAIVSEIGQRSSLFIAGREGQIAAGVKRQLSGAARQYGIAVKDIAITHALMKYPTPAQSVSPLTEVSRLNAMDPAVRNASKTTVKHAEKMMDAEATALGGKDGKEREDSETGNGKSHG